MNQTEKPRNLQEYLASVSETDPKTALEIAMAETNRMQAEALKAREEYRSMAEIEFDNEGRIVKANMAGLYRLANIYAQSSVVPAQFVGKPANCFIACQLACRMKVDPFAVMQRLYIVKGKPAMEAQLAIACLNVSDATVGRIRWKFSGEGETRACTAYVVDRETGDELDLTIDWSTVKGEGWYDKNDSKWKTMPDQMFRYRTATWLIRAYYPEVMMGLRTTDEVEDMAPSSPTEKPVRTIDELTEHLANAMPVGTMSHTGPMPSDEELAAREQEQEREKGQNGPSDQNIEDFRATISRKLDRCDTIESLESTYSKMLAANKHDPDRMEIVTELAALRDADIRDAAETTA